MRWKENNTLNKAAKLTEGYFGNKKVNYGKFKDLIDSGRIVWKDGSKVKTGDRIVRFNGTYYLGILDIEKVEYEYGAPNVWGTMENTGKKCGADISDGADVIVDDSIKESDFAYNTKVFSIKVELNGVEGRTRLELPDHFTAEDVEKSISVTAKEI